jgi:hypothetical protein
MALKGKPLDVAAAELILHDWACGNLETSHAKRGVAALGFTVDTVDFSQAVVGNWIDAEYRDGSAVTLYI